MRVAHNVPDTTVENDLAHGILRYNMNLESVKRFNNVLCLRCYIHTNYVVFRAKDTHTFANDLI